MIKVKEYNFACEIVKVEFIGRPYILEFGDNQTGKRDRLGNFHIGLLIVKLYFGVLLHKCIYI